MPAKKPKQTIKEKIHLLAAKLKKRAAVYRARRPHRTFKKTQRPRQQLGGNPVPPVSFLLSDTLVFVWSEKRLFICLAFLYSAITYIFIGGISQFDFIALREATSDVIGGDLAAFGNMLVLFGGILGSATASAPSQLQQFLSVLIGFIFWLAIIWAARMRLAGKTVRMRDALYNCCGPLIPSFTILITILLQLVPSLLAVLGWSLLEMTGWIKGGVEAMIIITAIFLVFLLSAYWISGSLVALVIATLPGTYPWRALSAASELVIGQRWRLALHMGVISVLILVVWVVGIGLALVFDNWLRFDWFPIIPILVQLFSGVTLVVIAVYIYKLYRSLL